MVTPIEDGLRRVAIGCAIVMFLAPIGDRTTVKGGGYTVDAAGYNIAALVSGLTALAALGIAIWARPRLVVPLLGALVALAAFALTVYASGIYVLARTRGEVFFYGTGEFMRITPKVDPAIGPYVFTLGALIGGLATLALGVHWLWLRKAA